MAVVTCSSCNVRINVKDEMLGKRVKCPKCAALIVLEAASGPAPSPWKKVSPPAPVTSSPMRPLPPAPAPAAITRTPPKPPPPPVLDELDEVDDEPPARVAKRRPQVDDDDDIEDAEPDYDAPRRSLRRDDDEDVDDRRGRRSRVEDERPRSRPGSPKWQTARLGLNIALTAVILSITAHVGMNVVSMATPAVFIGAINQPNQFGPRPMGPNMEGFRVLGAISILCGTLLFVGAVCHFVSMCMSISAPNKTAEGRARKAMIFFLVAFVLSLLTVCVMFSLMWATVNNALNNRNVQPQNLFNSMMLMWIIGGFLALVIAGFSIAHWVFWMLYHASVADAFRKPNLRSHAIMMLIAGLVVAVVVAGVSGAIQIMLIRPDGMPGLGVVMNALISMAGYGGLAGWYIWLNRSLARLM